LTFFLSQETLFLRLSPVSLDQLCNLVAHLVGLVPLPFLSVKKAVLHKLTGERDGEEVALLAQRDCHWKHARKAFLATREFSSLLLIHSHILPFEERALYVCLPVLATSSIRSYKMSFCLSLLAE
jgi:hypothetical protein